MTASSANSNSSSTAGKVFLYFSPLTLLVYLALPHAYLLDIATSFMLKNQLHASASQVSLFRLLTALPVYLSIVFGMTRDLWNPLGRRDRGYFLAFAPATAVVFMWMASTELSYTGLFVGMLLVMFLFRFIAAAHQGLMALIGQEQLMSGRLSALWQIVSTIPYVAGSFASGWMRTVPGRRKELREPEQQGDARRETINQPALKSIVFSRGCGRSTRRVP